MKQIQRKHIVLMLGIALQLPWLLCAQNPMQQYWILVGSSCSDLNLSSSVTLPAPYFTARNIIGTSYTATIPTGATLQLGCGNATGTTSAILAGAGGLKKIGTGAITLIADNTYTGNTAITGGTLRVGDCNTGSLGGGTYAGAIANSGSLIINTPANQTLSGIISGAGTLSKLCTSTAILTASNTYTGATTITAGALQIGNSGATGSIANTVNIVNNAALIYNTTSNLTQSQVISGTGTLTQKGTGNVTLSNSNSYTGGTTVNAGTLTLPGGASVGNIRGTLTINNGGTVQANSNWGLGYGNTTCVSAIAINGGVLNFYGTPGAGGTSASTITMTGGSIIGNSFDWYNGITSTPTLTVNASANTATISSGMNLRLGTGSVTFNVAKGTTASGNDLVVSGPITSISASTVIKSGLGTMLLTGANTYTGNTTVNAGIFQVGDCVTGSLGGGSYAGAITNNGSLIINTPANQTLSGIISGTGTLTKLCTSTAILTGANTYTGSTTITAGTLQVGDCVTGSLGGGSYAGAISNNGSLIINTPANQTLSGIISGTGTLTKLCTSTAILTGANTYTGSTTITAGTLQVGDCVTGSLGGGSYAGAITNNGSLIINTPANQTLSGIISGTGSLTKLCASTATLTGANTYTGNTTVNAGIIKWSGNPYFNVGRTTTIATGAVFELNNSNNVIAGYPASTVTGSGTFRLTGTTAVKQTAVGGTLTMSMGIGGLIDLQDASMLTNGGYSSMDWTNNKAAMNIATGATLDLWDGNTVYIDALTGSGTVDKGYTGTNSMVVGVANGSGTFSGIIKNTTGTVAFAKSGTGIQTLTGANTYTGNTTINAGTLQIGDCTTGSLGGGSYAGAIANNGSLIINTPVDQTLSGVISGTGSLTKLCTSTLSLTNYNTYSGGTTVNNGVLKLGKATVNGTGAIVGTLTINANGEVDASTTNWDLGWGSSRVSTININGGKLVFNGTNYDGGMNANVTLNGGTISGSGFDWYSGGSISITATDNSNITAGINLRTTLNVSVDAGKTLSIIGPIVNSLNNQAIVKTGAGTLLLSGANTYTGATTVNAGTLIFSNTNAYTGVTTINAGTLQIGNGGATGSMANTSKIVNNGTLVYNTTADLTQSQLISGTGSVTQNGTGIVSLGAGGTLVYGATVGNGGATVATNVKGNAGGAGAGGSGACAGANLAGNSVSSGAGGTGFVLIQYFDGVGATLDYDYITTTNTNYSIPTGAVTMKIWAVGGGASGSGGFAVAGSVGGGGGGAGGVAWATVNVGTATTMSITVGAGGVATNGNGNAGGNTVVTVNDVTLTANGGSAGTSAWPCNGVGGDGGTATVTGVVLASGTAKGGAGVDGGGGAGGAIGNNGATGTTPIDVSGLQAAVNVLGGTKNTYTGNTIINAGTLKALTYRAFGYGTITVNAGATLDRNGFAIPNTIINNGGTVIN